ncbi:MAG: hypothetical protein WC273_03980 [Dehalococcoidia bacterium]
MNPQPTRPRLAIECHWLKRSLDPSRRDPYAMCCTHIVREGEECVGPFLEELETSCGLWAPGAIPVSHGRPRTGRR